MMRRIRIDFSGSPSPWRLAGVGMLVLALAAAAGLGNAYRRATDALETAKATMRAKEKRRPQPVPAAPQTEELEAARQAIDHLAVPWGGVFHALEAHTRTDIALLAVEPDAAGQTVKLTAAARDFPAVLDYLQDMQAAPVLTDVHLVNHRQEPQDPAWPWRFELQARWIVVSVNPK